MGEGSSGPSPPDSPFESSVEQGNLHVRLRSRTPWRAGDMVPNEQDLHTTESTLPDGRAVITRRINAPPRVVWSVLADGWMYATWVVGASRVRLVDPQWPAPGRRLHHSFGIWPAMINDHTEVLTADPGRELLLLARGWPAGEATVRIRVT